ncbi:EAL domain-containing protein [Wukongibacter baidiensis]|uniref:putative bifunctional diguanylate cyclase/phosphodiesterase n=1 Tax=Wukongibacter baidiensis TaxID=1723361 RepID=UPI003D7F2669
MLKIFNSGKLTKKISCNDLNFQDMIQSKHTQISPAKTALKIAAFYIVIGSLWILLSDKLLEILVEDTKKIQILQTYKGWLYIIITGALLFLRIRKSLVKIEVVSNKLFRSYEELNSAYEELIATEEDLNNRFQQLKSSQDALAESEARYHLAVMAAKDGIWDWDLRNDRRFFSIRCKEMLGYDASELEYNFEIWKDLLHPLDKEDALKSLNDYLDKKIDNYANTYRLRTKNGDYKWILSRGEAIWDENGRPIRMAGSHTDITEQKKYEERVLSLAYYDLITGLPNRAMFEKELNSMIFKAKEKGEKFALLYLDLDDFKKVNDTLGHDYGDKLLKMVASEFMKHKKTNEILARLGGDEFALMVPDVKDMNKVHNISNEIINALNRPWILNSQEFYISASIGIAIFPDHGEDYQSLYKSADTAMYSAKEKGKRSYEIYKQEMYMQKIQLVDMEKSLRYAVKNNEFILNYQSMINLKNDEINAAEALIRWVHPKKGLISPVNFIPIAEKTGIIKEIGKWTIATGCEQNKVWIDKGYKPIKLSINISALEFKQNNLVQNIKTILEETGLDSKYIIFEITENTALEDLDHTIKILNELKEMNIKIALDDFGTGYSSLNYLKQLPIDYLKLDKSFIKNVTTKSKDQAITKSLIDLAHEIGLEVIAEGIETEEQYRYLKEINCDIGQGYFFNKPSSTEEFERMF